MKLCGILKYVQIYYVGHLDIKIDKAHKLTL